MRLEKLLLQILIIGLLLGGSINAWAKSSAAGGVPTCLTSNPGNGALAIRGTINVEVTGGLDNIFGPQDADFTLRLERSGATNFFRLHLSTPIAALSNEEIACRILDNNANPDVTTFVQQILTAFGIQPTRVFVITDKSISNAEALGTDKTIPGTSHASSMVDVTIYAQ